MQKLIVLLMAAFAGLLLVYWLAIDSYKALPNTEPTMVEVPAETPPARPQLDQTGKDIPPATEEHFRNIKGFELSLDSQGSLIPTPAVRELFDQLARQNGETPVDQWKGQVLNESKDKLTPEAFEQLKSSLNRYIEYNLALQMLPMEGAPSLTAAIEQIKSLRKDYLGFTNAEGMFSDWEQLEQFTDEYVSLMLNEKNPIQLQQQLEKKIEELPASVKPRAQNVLDQSQELLSTLSVAVADPEGFRALAEQTAAQALIQPNFNFSDPDPQFLQRYEEYKAAREELLKNSQPRGSQETALQDLRKELFSGTELLRVETLERSERL